MIKIFFLFFICLFSLFSVHGQGMILKNGMTIKNSVVIDSSHYKLNAKKKNKPVLTIKGNDVVIDFMGATLEGSIGVDSPDQYFGTAIKISKGKNITIRNLRIIGYRNAIEAVNIEGLTLENCDFSYNYRRATVKLAPSQDNYSHPLAGNSIELIKCKNVGIIGCRARANENVVLMMNCTNSLLVNNDFSFNSGAAVVLKNSDNNQFLYNRFNFNVADTLLKGTASFIIDGNSSSNIIYKNSITHSANGIIMGGTVLRKHPKPETRNIIMENDLSYNYSSGVTSYFTDAIINKNRIYESVFGNRIFFPRNQSVSNNHFRYNSVAIEVSGNGFTTIHHNIFLEDNTALRIWGKGTGDINQPLKAVVVANSFNRNRVVYNLDRVDSLAEFNNHYQQYDTLFKADTSMMNMDVAGNEDVLVELSADLIPGIQNIPVPANPFKGNGRLAGKNNLVLGRWGPFDFSYPLATITGKDSSGAVEVMVLGPEGEWSVKELKGGELVSVSGATLPGRLLVKKTGTEPVRLRLEFKGLAYSGSRGEVKMGVPVLFSPGDF